MKYHNSHYMHAGTEKMRERERERITRNCREQNSTDYKL